MVGADGLGSKEDVRVFSLIVPRSSCGAFRLQRFQRGVRKWWHLRIECPTLSRCSEDPAILQQARLFGGDRHAADRIEPAERIRHWQHKALQTTHPS
jgi:hypothetical protein